MKLGLCTWSYHRTIEAGKLDLESLMKLCADELKVGGIDIITDHLVKTDKKYLTGIKKLASDELLTIACLSPGNNFGKPTAGERAEEVRAVKKWIDAGYVLGAPVLRIFAGWPWPPEKAKELWPDMVDCIKECIKPAEEAGIVLAVEPHNDGGFLPTSKEALKLIEEIDSEWVKLNLDTGNYTDKDIYSGLEKSMPYTYHAHAKIHKLSPEGEELKFDYDRICAILKDANYRGFLSLEYEGKEAETEYVPKALEMIRRYAAKHGL